MTTTTTAPLTRRQAREIERLTGTRPVASAGQEFQPRIHEATVTLPAEREALFTDPAVEPAIAGSDAEQEGQERPAQVPAAFAAPVRSVSVRAQRPLALARARRRRIGGFATIAGAAALATAATVSPFLGELGSDADRSAAANLGAGVNAGGSSDQVADPQGPAVQVQTSFTQDAELHAAPESVSGYDVVHFSSDQLSSAAAPSPADGGSAASAEAQPAVAQAQYVSPFPGGTYSEGYGTRGGAHNGIDVVSAGGGTCGADLIAVTSGTVTFAGYQGGYGNHVELRLEDGTTISYSHLQDGGIRVAVGQQVSAGDLIGLAGTTGNSTGCHLHFEVKQNGSFVNPTTWLAQYGLGF